MADITEGERLNPLPPRERVREGRKFKRIAFDVTCNYGVTIIGSNSYIYFETVWIGI